MCLVWRKSFFRKMFSARKSFSSVQLWENVLPGPIRRKKMTSHLRVEVIFPTSSHLLQLILIIIKHRKAFLRKCSQWKMTSVIPNTLLILLAFSLLFTFPLYRTPSAPKIGLPPTLPWVSIPYKEYWRLCHEAVLDCRQDCYCQLHQ